MDGNIIAILTEVAIIPATIAIVNRVKKEVPTLKSYWLTLMSFGVAAILYVVVMYAPIWLAAILTLGLAASGIFDIREGSGNIMTSDDK